MLKDNGDVQKIENLSNGDIIGSAFIFGKDNNLPVDLIVLESEELHQKMKDVKCILERKGYKFKKENWDAYRVYLYFWHVDIYINKRGTDNYLGAEGESSDIPIEYIGSKSVIKWNNQDVKCPEKIHDTLVWRYGNDYMVPKYFYKGRCG